LPAQDAEGVLNMNKIEFAPIAMPLISGPGSIAVTRRQAY